MPKKHTPELTDFDFGDVPQDVVNEFIENWKQYEFAQGYI